MNRQPCLRVAVLLAWFTFILALLAGGNLAMYIRTSYTPLAVVGLVILAALAVRRGAARADSAESLSVTSLIIFLAPVLLIAVVRPGALSSLAAENRGISTSFTGTDASVADVLAARIETEGGYRNLTLKQLLVLITRDPGQAGTLPVAVEGFVYGNAGQSAGSFMLARFLITCCAADATPLGIRVVWNGAAPRKNAWLTVRGKISCLEKEPYLTADEVKESAAPTKPYLY